MIKKNFLPIILYLFLFASQAFTSGLRLPFSTAYLSTHPDRCAFVEFSSHMMMSMALYGDYIARWPFPEKGSPPHFKVVAEGGQDRLRDRNQIEIMKEAMLKDSFEYEALDARIGGTYDGAKSTFIVNEGRHRLNAALEVAHETGDWKPFITLINFGRWDFGTVPKGARSLYFKAGSAPINQIIETLSKITPREQMPSSNAIIRLFKGQ